MKISVITVSFNAVETIEETILSVLGQTYENIEYIIIDGGSTDGTIEVIKKYEDNLFWISEPDNGMYDALAKGLKKATGDICAYINADDFYNKCAFNVINEIFSSDHSIKWATGINISYNKFSQVTETFLPYKYKQKWIINGVYGTELPVIQQESTFWRRELLDGVDFEKLSQCKLAGDFYLWKCFAEKYELNIIQAHLGGFRYRKDQLSSNKSSYSNELKMLSEKNISFYEILFIYIEKIFWYLADRMKVKINKNIYLFDYREEVWKKSRDSMI